MTDAPTNVSILLGTASDEDILAHCAAKVEGWADLRPDEQAEMVRLMRRFGERPMAPSFQQCGERRVTPTGNHTLYSLRMAELMACTSDDYEARRLSDLSSTGSASEISARLAFVQGAKPQDTVQSTLAVQMAMTHDAGLKALRMAGDALTVEQAQVCGNLATRLLNVYTRQAETLAKLQRDASQVVKVVYQHVDQRTGVHVAPGAQAMVAETFNSGGVSSNVDHQAYGTDTIGLSPEVLGYDPQGHGVPITSGEREGAMSHPRRGQRVGRAKG